MKRILKFLGIGLLLLVLAGIVLFFMYNQSEPAGKKGSEADEVARKMMESVNVAAWDSTKYIQWTFSGMNDYLWDKERHFVKVTMGEDVVLLNTKKVNGIAFSKGEKLEGEAANELIQKAWKNFCNDSFWLNPVVKAFDPGTERSLVTLEDGREGLKVQYTSGGVTPGDAYVWILDENFKPIAWKMWVQIIPVGGMENSWQDWRKLYSGAEVSVKHSLMGKEVEMISNLKSAPDFAGMGETSDPFLELENLL